MRHVNEWFSFDTYRKRENHYYFSSRALLFRVLCNTTLQHAANDWNKGIAYLEYFMEFYTSGGAFLGVQCKTIAFAFIEVNDGIM